MDVFHATPLGSFIEFFQTTFYWNKVSQTFKQPARRYYSTANRPKDEYLFMNGEP